MQHINGLSGQEEYLALKTMKRETLQSKQKRFDKITEDFKQWAEENTIEKFFYPTEKTSNKKETEFKTNAEQYEERMKKENVSFTLTPCATCGKKLTVREYKFAQKLAKPNCYSCQRL